MKTTFRWKLGSAQSKAIAVLFPALVVLTPLTPAYASFGGVSPTVINSDVFSGEAEIQKVDEPTGAFTQKIAVDIPPGRNGLQPDLSLDYNSQDTADGIVGYGWSLSIPYIQRLNKTGSQDLYGNTPYFTSSLDGELAPDGTNTLAVIATTSPRILDSLPLPVHSPHSVTSDSFSYSVPSGASNKILLVLVSKSVCGDPAPTATFNGASTSPFSLINGSTQRGCYYSAYLANPSSGTSTFQINFASASYAQYVVMTLQNALQASPVDATNGTYDNSTSSKTTSVTTTAGNDILLSFSMQADCFAATSFGPGESQIFSGSDCSGMGPDSGTWRPAASSSGPESMTTTWNHTQQTDEAVFAIKPYSNPAGLSTTTTYRARVGDGSSNSYSFSNNTWTVYDKKGTRYLYGSDDVGRQYDTSAGTSTRTSRWYLQEVRDTNNNYISYSYTRDGNQLYPSQIVYTGHGSSAGISSITFATSTRPDARTSYASDFAVTMNYRISEVDASVNGAVVRKYLLGYVTGNNGFRSLLTSVQEEGYDDNNDLIALPATTFSYASSSTQFYAPPSGGTFDSQAWVTGDINGNGINDATNFYYIDSSHPYLEDMWVDNSTRVNLSFTPPEYWASNASPHIAFERGVRLVDVNADGKADVVRGYYNYTTSTSTNEVLLNTYSAAGGYGWSATSTGTGVIPAFDYDGSGSLFNITTGLVGDVNGDGLPDFEQDLNGTYNSAYLGNGTAFDATTTAFAPKYTMPYSSSIAPIWSELIDINGDSLDDWVYSDNSGSTYVLINTGTGWGSSPDPSWTLATSTLYNPSGTSDYYDRGMRFMDINGDGLPDFVRSYQNTKTGPSACSGPERADVKAVYVNTGDGWATSTAYSLPSTYIMSCGGNSNGSPIMVPNEYGNWTGNGQMPQDVITKVINSKGGYTNVSYTPSAQLGTNSNLPYSILVATAIGIYDGLGNAATTTYAFSGGQQYAGLGVRDRKFAGFATTTVTAPDSITATLYDQGDGIQTQAGEQSDGYAQVNHPFRKDVYDLSNNLKQRTYYRWDTILHGLSTYVGLGRQLSEDFASDGTHRDKAIEYSYSSTTDDLLQAVEYGEVTGSSDGSFIDISGDTRTTNISYAASSSINMSLPVEKTVLDSQSATSTNERLYYDALPFGQITLGNNTREEDWISGTTYASSTKTYNSFGLVSSSTDRDGNAASYVYDAYDLYVATSTNPLLQRTESYYNYSNGKPKQSADPNGRLARMSFDGVGRIIEVDQSSTSSPSTYETATTYAYTDNTTTPSLVHTSDYLTGASTVDTFDYYDGLNRLIQERKNSQSVNVYSTSDRVYNGAGELASSSLPYFSSGSSYTSPISTTAFYTTYVYDALQRTTNISNAVGSTGNTYSKWTTTTTDPNGHVKDYWHDAFGNLATVVEHLDSSIATTSYGYDLQNDLASTTDALGNVRHFTYDGLGRRLTAEDLHAPGDTTYGTSTYSYDPQGNLISQTNAKGQTVNRTYDALNRMLTEDYTGQAGTEVTDTYDSCTDGIGYLCTASSTSAITSNSYDILGRTVSATTTVNSTAYNMQYAYDRQGSITGETYPDGSQVTVSFNLAGEPSHIQRKPSAGPFTDIISNYDYAPQGQILNVLFGNDASTTYFYNASAIYRLSNLQTTSNGTDLQDFAYTYDAVGNITQIANAASTSARAVTQYSYDALNRLLGASTASASSSPYTQQFTYDALGNILTNLFSTSTQQGASLSPTILDSTPLVDHVVASVTSDSSSYSVPSGGNNKMLIVLVGKNSCGDPAPTATLDGVSLSGFSLVSGSWIRACYYSAYLANPSSGTFQINFSSPTYAHYVIMTLQNTAQIQPIDATNSDYNNSANTITVSTSTTVGNDLMLSFSKQADCNSPSYGAGQTQLFTTSDCSGMGPDGGSWRAAASTPGSESMTTNWSGTQQLDEAIWAVKAAFASGTTTASAYAYAGSGYASPHALTSLSNGFSTTTYAYDNNGNVTQKTTDGTTTTYVWDYANRLIALGVAGATTTYAYDAFGNRVLQTASSTTFIYPFKWMSIASSTGSAAKFSTTTDYIFNGDNLVSTVDQQFAAGVATGTAKTRYIHPDHLGSTNVVTDENGGVVQTLDYYPYGSTRVSSGQNIESRQYVGQFTDNSTLSYLQARYYDSSRGQFLSEDPVFLGDPKDQDLQNPQSLNAYSYANDNPITGKDPNGKQVAAIGAATVANPTAGLVVAALYAAALALAYIIGTIAASAHYNVNVPASTPTQIVQTVPFQHLSPTTGLGVQLTPPASPFSTTPISGVQDDPFSSFAPYVFSDNGKGSPKSPKNFIQPTNPPQQPPSQDQLPPGHTVRKGGPTPEYPNGYWRQYGPDGRAVDPSTGQYPADVKSGPEFESRTHVPLPPGSAVP